MKASYLQNILDKWNNDAFESLGGHISSDTLPQKCGAKLFKPLTPDIACHCGEFTGKQKFPDAITHPQSKDALAVGAVLDDKTDTTDDPDLNVIVTVGINYGQFSTTSSSSAYAKGKDWRQTGMRPRIFTVVNMLVNSKCLDRPNKHDRNFGPEQYHLVAVNYFPWITCDTWTNYGLNAIAEALVIRCWGYDHPAKRIADLIDQIAQCNPGTQECAGTLSFVIFHGAKSAVPHLGIETRRLVQTKGQSFTNYIMSDNLAPNKNGNNISNAVILLPATPLPLARHNCNIVDDS